MLNNYSDFDHRQENELAGMPFALFETQNSFIRKIDSKGQHN